MSDAQACKIGPASWDRFCRFARMQRGVQTYLIGEPATAVELEVKAGRKRQESAECPAAGLSGADASQTQQNAHKGAFLAGR
ncbi:hypothetical protein HK102_004273, partial [Quaeritorhiza haematococci]